MDDQHTVRAPRRRRGVTGTRELVLTVCAIAATVLVLKQVVGARAGESAGAAIAGGSLTAVSATQPAQRPTAAQAIGAFTVRNQQGKVVPLVTPGEPSIVMVSSVTCSWCKRALKDLGELSAGRPLPRLKLLTLEGAAEGAPMLAKEKIVGAQLIGPAGSTDQVLLTFRYPGTPTFVAIDREGRVVATMPGYPMREVMKTWYAVMVGDADTP